MTISPTFYKTCIALLLIAVLLLWFTRGCNSQPPALVTQNQQTNDSVGKLLDSIHQSNIRVGVLLEDSIQQAGVISDKDIKLFTTQGKLDQTNKEATTLANDVVAARVAHDTAKYDQACDSLAFVTQRDQYIKDSLKTATQGALAARDRANAIANTAKGDLQKQAVAYSGALSLLQKTNANLAAAVLPKSKLFIGGEVFAANGVGGVGPGLLYEDKQERQYGVAGGIATTGGWWVGGKVYFKIQLHK